MGFLFITVLRNIEQIIKEGGRSNKKNKRIGTHLEHQCTKAPPVNSLAISVALQHLRSEVFGSAAESSCARVFSVQTFFGETKISHYNMAVTSQQQVLRLQISVNKRD